MTEKTKKQVLPTFFRTTPVFAFTLYLYAEPMAFASKRSILPSIKFSLIAIFSFCWSIFKAFIKFYILLAI